MSSRCRRGFFRGCFGGWERKSGEREVLTLLCLRKRVERFYPPLTSSSVPESENEIVSAPYLFWCIEDAYVRSRTLTLKEVIKAYLVTSPFIFTFSSKLAFRLEVRGF